MVVSWVRVMAGYEPLPDAPPFPHPGRAYSAKTVKSLRWALSEVLLYAHTLGADVPVVMTPQGSKPAVTVGIHAMNKRGATKRKAQLMSMETTRKLASHLHVVHQTVALPAAAGVVVAALGVSLIVAGATLVWKRIQLVNDTVLMLVFPLSAAAIPMVHVPGWWSDASRAFPLTAGVAGLYRVLIAHHATPATWGMGGLVWIAVTAGYLATGVAAFGLGRRTAARRGTLARY